MVFSIDSFYVIHFQLFIEATYPRGRYLNLCKYWYKLGLNYLSYYAFYFHYICMHIMFIYLHVIKCCYIFQVLILDNYITFTLFELIGISLCQASLHICSVSVLFVLLAGQLQSLILVSSKLLKDNRIFARWASLKG